MLGYYARQILVQKSKNTINQFYGKVTPFFDILVLQHQILHSSIKVFSSAKTKWTDSLRNIVLTLTSLTQGGSSKRPSKSKQMMQEMTCLSDESARVASYKIAILRKDFYLNNITGGTQNGLIFFEPAVSHKYHRVGSSRLNVIQFYT